METEGTVQWQSSSLACVFLGPISSTAHQKQNYSFKKLSIWPKDQEPFGKVEMKTPEAALLSALPKRWLCGHGTCCFPRSFAILSPADKAASPQQDFSSATGAPACGGTGTSESLGHCCLSGHSRGILQTRRHRLTQAATEKPRGWGRPPPVAGESGPASFPRVEVS